MMTEQTTILHKCYEAIKDAGLYYDFYVVLDHNGGTALGITSVDLAYISARSSEALSFMEYLENANKTAMSVTLLPKAFTHNDIDTMIVRCSKKLTKHSFSYEGYELAQTENSTFCNFVFASDSKFYTLSYNLTAMDNRISNIQYPSYKN